MKTFHGSVAYDSQQTFGEMVEDTKKMFQPIILTRKFWTELLQTYLTDVYGHVDSEIFQKTYHEQLEVWLVRYESEVLRQKEQEIITLVEKIMPTLKVPRLNLWIFIDSVCDQYRNQVPARYMYIFKSCLYKAANDVLENACPCCGKPL